MHNMIIEYEKDKREGKKEGREGGGWIGGEDEAMSYSLILGH
jgi:hypothetical protein